jgi:hypothetical protein
MEKLGLTVSEAATLSSLGQTSIYKAIRRTLAISQVRRTHHHHALRSGVVLGKSAGREMKR